MGLLSDFGISVLVKGETRGTKPHFDVGSVLRIVLQTHT